MLRRIPILATTLLFPGLLAAQELMDRPIAFPGAEGYGRYAVGGRGGRVCIVSNLDDRGVGSFREAAGMKEPRIILFSVSGTIHLESPLTIVGPVTIAGQSAPGDGICIADHPVRLRGDQIVIRYLRFRLGDRHQAGQGKVPGSGGDDALGGTGNRHLVIDHCSLSWSTDEVLSVYNGDSSTLQWNLISEPLDYSYHFEEGDADWEHHGYGGIWGGRHLSAHHNLFAHCVSRNPRFNGARMGASEEFVDFRNNVVYDWRSKAVYGGEGGLYNVVGNLFKPGPSTSRKAGLTFLEPTRAPGLPLGRFHVAGNVLDGNPAVTADNRLGVDQGNGGELVVPKAFPAEPVTTQSAADSYELVLRQVGASLCRDTLDHRIIRDVRKGEGRIMDVQGGYPHGTPYGVSHVAWPRLRTKPALSDTDADGMPDEWERLHGLDPNDPADAVRTSLHAYYTNVEVYINGRIP